MNVRSVVETAFFVSVVGAAGYAAGNVAQYGGEQLLSHLEAEKITSSALWAIAKGCEGGGDFLARGGWFVATLIPSYTYKVGAAIQHQITPPFVERVFENAISPAFSAVSGFANNSVVQPIIEHGPKMAASFGKDWFLPAAGEVMGATKWTFGTALPKAFNFAIFSMVVPTVTTVGSLALQFTRAY